MLFERANSLENKKPPVYPEVFYFTLLKQNLFCQSLKGTEAKMPMQRKRHGHFLLQWWLCRESKGFY
jgi:hypothetical protein